MPHRRKNTTFTWASWASKGPLTDLELFFLTNLWLTHTHIESTSGKTHSCSLGLVNTCYAYVRRVSHASQGEIPVERPGAEKWGTLPQILLHQPVSATGSAAGPLHALLWNPPHPLLCPSTGESYLSVFIYWAYKRKYIMLECLNFYPWATDQHQGLKIHRRYQCFLHCIANIF